MKRITKITAVVLLAVMAVGCTPANVELHVGLVTNDETADPNATRIEAPDMDSVPEVNIRPDETATPSVSKPITADKPTVPGETRISFLAAGDNIIHENVFLDAKSRAGEGEKYNFVDMYDGVADVIAAADIAFINQETPICGDEMGVSGYPNFNTPEAAGDALIELGFDIVNIANNHMLDKKHTGYMNTLDYWHEREDDILMLGGYYNKADYENIRVYEEQGISIAFVSYTYSTNGMTLPNGSELYVPYINQNEIVAMTQKASELADLVFVVMHWGVENSFAVSAEQKKLANAITEAGADVILGMHAHVIQPIEWLTASDGTKTLVTYSLGNFISTQYENQNLVGGMIAFDIVRSADGKLSIESPLYIPTVTHYNKQRLGLQVYLMEDYTEELVAAHGNPNYGTSAGKRIWTTDKIRSFVTDNVSDEFLPDFLK